VPAHPDYAPIASAIIAALTFVALAVGKLPRLQMNRAAIALAGAGLILVLNVVSFEEAMRSIDLSTIFLLLSMMVVNAVLELAGFFTWVGELVIERAQSPVALLVLVVLTAGVLSALFINDPVALMLTPLVCGVVMRLKRDPLPYLIALATAANIGSAATITGNPQNILIGTSSGIPFVTFLARIAPVSLVGMAIVVGVLLLLYRREFARPLGVDDPETPLAEFQPNAVATQAGGAASYERVYVPVLRKSLIVIGLMLVAFLANVNVALAAYLAACALLVTRRIRSEQILALIDWPLLLLFLGLFIVTGSLEHTGASGWLFERVRLLAFGGTAPLTLVMLALSNLISNVPAVLLFRPLVPQFADPERTWLVLAAASTLAGNLTLIGSVANLIVAEQARKFKIDLSFGAFLRAGIPITLLSLLAVIALL
jgi:Na+/H+ antiporter NhaD/arsenite permease-like protein